MADRLASDLDLIHTAILTISDLYNSLDDDSQENGKRPTNLLLTSILIQEGLVQFEVVCYQ